LKVVLDVLCLYEKFISCKTNGQSEDILFDVLAMRKGCRDDGFWRWLCTAPPPALARPHKELGQDLALCPLREGTRCLLCRLEEMRGNCGFEEALQLDAPHLTKDQTA